MNLLYVHTKNELSNNLFSNPYNEKIIVASVQSIPKNMSLIQLSLHDAIAINTECRDWILYTAEISNIRSIPIVVISDTYKVADMITAFRVGADEYIHNDMLVMERIMRIENSIRRYLRHRIKTEAESNRGIKAGEFEIDCMYRIVRKKGSIIELTKTEFDLMELFVRHKGQVLSREQLSKNLWNDENAIDDTAIMAHIHRLRLKIEDKPDSPEHIITVRGIGYKFI